MKEAVGRLSGKSRDEVTFFICKYPNAHLGCEYQSASKSHVDAHLKHRKYEKHQRPKRMGEADTECKNSRLAYARSVEVYGQYIDNLLASFESSVAYDLTTSNSPQAVPTSATPLIQSSCRRSTAEKKFAC